MADNFFAFHYRFIAANLTPMTVMSPDRFYATCVAPVLDHYVSDRFETVCMEYLVRKNRAGTFPYPFTDIGRYWYHEKNAVLPAARVGAFSLSGVAPEVAKRYPLAFSADDLFQ